MQKLKDLLKKAILEDCPKQDLTSTEFITQNPLIQAQIIAKETGVFYGQETLQRN